MTLPTLIALLVFQATQPYPLHKNCGPNHNFPCEMPVSTLDEPPPFDVPPIQEFLRHVEEHQYQGCAPTETLICLPFPIVPAHDEYRTTCADKHRILLTSEDGEKHCILFPKEK